MLSTNKDIDHGKEYDFGKTSLDYAKYRDIYPKEYYSKVHSLGICTQGQKVLDLGTGTGVLPRNMYHYGAEFVGVDISSNQIAQAKELSKANGMDITYISQSAESLNFEPSTFDVVTACQCFWYFNHQTLAPKVHQLLKSQGKFAILCMEWLPFEDKVAQATEDLILKYNPQWSGGGEVRHKIEIPEVYNQYFNLESSIVFDLKVPFTIDTWNGRIKTCRGIGASLSPEKVAQFEKEHVSMLQKITPPTFEVLHYGAIAILTKKD